MKIQDTRDSRLGQRALLMLSAALLVSPWMSAPVDAGAFRFAGEANGTDIILHPQGYTGSQTSLPIEVCIDSTASTVPAGATALTDVEQSVRNMVEIWNQLQPIDGNVRLFGNNNIPNTPVLYDFESVALHELGHCIGLAHVNAASESELSGADSNYTKATDGINNVFNIMPGGDGVIGSKDDVRGDDVNLHWFRTDTNDPGKLPLPVPVDNTTYDRDQSSLPTGSLFAANLDRVVAGTLGYPNTSTVKTEAVMQQGTFNDEEQRRLTADGVATVLLGMSGVDETAGTDDDYVINLTYGGIKTSPTGCDLDIRFTGNSFAFCSTGGFFVAQNHVRISDSNAFMQFGPAAVNWFFNQTGACRQTLDLVTGQWKQMALSCDPPSVPLSNPPNTVAALLGDDLTGTYDVDWVVYERDAVNNEYDKLGLLSTMEVGRGYWIKTIQASQTIEIEGDFNANGDIALESDPAGRWNMVGHRYWYDEAWADVRVIDSANPSTPLTLDQADPDTDGDGPLGPACEQIPVHSDCVMSRIAHKYNTGGYVPFDGQTPGLGGTLQNFDGFFVKAYKSGISLRIPDKRSTPSAPNDQAPLQTRAGVMAAAAQDGSLLAKPVARAGGPNGWFIRLIAESGALRDGANVFGQLADSVDGYDWHDLQELPPFGSPYLTIVFPHEDWGPRNGDYSSDYRGLDTTRRDNIWHFEVRASDPDMDVTLSWENNGKGSFRDSTLTDLETGANVPVSETGTYTFNMGAESHRFRWTQNQR